MNLNPGRWTTRLAAAGIFLVVGVLAVMMLLLSVFTGFISGNQQQSAQASSCVDYNNSGGRTSGDDPQAPQEMRAEQEENAKAIAEVAEELGLDGRAAEVAIIAAYGESTLINVDYGDQRHGVTNVDGSAATSYGLFQQQTSMGWGSKDEVMDPKHAAKSFLTGTDNGHQGLIDIAGWEDMEPTQAIHEVQGNADPTHYVDSYEPARAVIERADIDVERDGKTTSDDAGNDSGAGDSSASDEEGSSGSSCGSSSGGKGQDAEDTYPWVDKTPGPGEYIPDPMGFYYGECTSYSGWKINEAMGLSAEDDPLFTNAVAGNAAEWRPAWEARGWEISTEPVPQSVAWWDANSNPNVGEAGHVGWVQDVKDGKVIVDEYNNSYYGPPGHKYSERPDPVDPNADDAPDAYLIPPEKDQMKKS